MSDQALMRRILACGGAILTLAIGIRFGFGFFLQPMSMQFGWPRETFSFAIALHNLVWGASQPFIGALADRFGGARVIAASAFVYAAGLALMTVSSTPVALALSTGLLIGVAAAGTTFSVIFSVIGRVFPPEKRSMAMGVSSALGSFGQFAMAPVEQYLISWLGWSGALVVLAALALVMIPLALGMRLPAAAHAAVRRLNTRQALGEAFCSRSFWLLTAGYFVCGFQAVFVQTHLPAFLGDLGHPVSVGATAIALIGLFNVFGSYAAGALGARYPMKKLLVGIYLVRAVAMALFVFFPVTPLTVYLFAMTFGLVFLSTVPPTNGIIANLFGVQHLAMLGGFVFFSHQIGSFLGAWLGGRLFDLSGSYDLVWTAGIGLGVVAALLHLPIREAPLLRPAAAPA